jgi:hypothetical protein
LDNIYMSARLMVTKHWLQMGLDTAKAVEDAGQRPPVNLKLVRDALKRVLRMREKVPFSEVVIEPNLPDDVRERVAHIVAAAATLAWLPANKHPAGSTEFLLAMRDQCAVFKARLLSACTTPPSA